ncbi:MAG: transposase, partial [Agathobacter sp.]|nr:transposase [Agathobacter sp.]
MQIYTTYKVKIKHYNHIFKDTVAAYRTAVDYLIDVCNANWDVISTFKGQNKLTYVESLIHATKDNP